MRPGFSFNSLQRVRQQTPPIAPTIWYTAYDNLHMTVNANGTGGAPSSGGTVGRLLDRSGNGNYVSNGSVSTQPIWSSGPYGPALNFPWYNPTGPVIAFMTNNAIPSTIPRDNCSGGFLMDIPGEANTAFLDMGVSELAIQTFNVGYTMAYFLGAAFVIIPNIYPSGHKLVVTWRSNGSDLIIRTNGQQFNKGSSAGAASMTRMHLSSFNGGAPEPTRLYEMCVYNTDIGASALTSLENYFRGRSGLYDPTRVVATFGDSLLTGVGSQINKPPWEYIASRSSSLWYAFNKSGSILHGGGSITAAALAALKGSNEGLCIIWMGTNDIILNVVGGTQLESDLNTYATTLKNAGWKVVVSTLQAFTTNNSERLIFNAAVKANYTNYANAFAKLDEASQLSDSTNLTYYQPDGVHLTDAGYAVAGGLLSTAANSVPTS